MGWDQKKKRWLDNKSRKLQKRKKNGSGNSFLSHNVKDTSNNSKNNTYFAKAPETFSFIYNTEETNQFFLDIIAEMEKRIYKQLFYIDSSEVKYITIDALVYILAILYNIKLNPILKYAFKGNVPEDKNAECVYNESGFMNYVKTKRAIMPETDDKVQIITGRNTDPNVAVKICDFVNSCFGKDYIFTIDLYKTLIELMSNTVHHAYNDNNIMAPHWYLYAINRGDSVQFTFIDTGEGIPNTVKRKFTEKFPFTINDSDLIYSAFLGESRTETGLYNRGHGLPALYEKVMKRRLCNFYVISGCGCCKSKIENDIIWLEKVDYKHEIMGTIFQFEIINIKEEIV